MLQWRPKMEMKRGEVKRARWEDWREGGAFSFWLKGNLQSFWLWGFPSLRCLWHFCVVLLDKESELYLGLLSPREKDWKENLNTSFETFSNGPLFFSFQFGYIVKIIWEFRSNCTLIIIILISILNCFWRIFLIILITGNNLET